MEAEFRQKRPCQDKRRSGASAHAAKEHRRTIGARSPAPGHRADSGV